MKRMDRQSPHYVFTLRTLCEGCIKLALKQNTSHINPYVNSIRQVT
jgi:hypothetical protein